MRWRILITLFLVASACECVVAATMPITAKEISLMLRSGYSSEAVLHELSARNFADTFDPAIEQQLVKAGASASLIEALRDGAYQLSDAEIAAFKEKVAADEERAAEGLEQSAEAVKKNEDRFPSSKTAAQTRPPDAVYRLVKGDLVYWNQGSLAPYDDSLLEKKKLYLFFFSAISSREGRQFTSQLVDYYKRIAPQHPEFEMIFFSADRSQFGMETYIAQSNMPWPAVAYDKLGSKADAIQRGVVREIPCLLLADAGGNILSTSQGDGGLQKVLADCDRVLAGGSASTVARKQ